MQAVQQYGLITKLDVENIRDDNLPHTAVHNVNILAKAVKKIGLVLSTSDVAAIVSEVT